MNQGSVDHHRSLASWILAPAVVMSLGWGLRGYIGGGPFGAMIPGALGGTFAMPISPLECGKFCRGCRV